MGLEQVLGWGGSYLPQKFIFMNPYDSPENVSYFDIREVEVILYFIFA
jgi:hypothetical protein